jgi:hypothetical protein
MPAMASPGEYTRCQVGQGAGTLPQAASLGGVSGVKPRARTCVYMASTSSTWKMTRTLLVQVPPDSTQQDVNPGNETQQLGRPKARPPARAATVVTMPLAVKVQGDPRRRSRWP